MLTALVVLQNKFFINNTDKVITKLNLNINRDYFYILLTPWPEYVRFLKKISKKNFFDTKHII